MRRSPVAAMVNHWLVMMAGLHRGVVFVEVLPSQRVTIRTERDSREEASSIAAADALVSIGSQTKHSGHFELTRQNFTDLVQYYLLINHAWVVQMRPSALR